MSEIAKALPLPMVEGIQFHDERVIAVEENTIRDIAGQPYKVCAAHDGFNVPFMKIRLDLIKHSPKLEEVTELPSSLLHFENATHHLDRAKGMKRDRVNGLRDLEKRLGVFKVEKVFCSLIAFAESLGVVLKLVMQLGNNGRYGISLSLQGAILRFDCDAGLFSQDVNCDTQGSQGAECLSPTRIELRPWHNISRPVHYEQCSYEKEKPHGPVCENARNSLFHRLAQEYLLNRNTPMVRH